MTGYWIKEMEGTGKEAIFDIIRLDLMEDITLCLFVYTFGATAPSGLGPPHSRGF
jgi:hypothetical protein